MSKTIKTDQLIYVHSLPEWLTGHLHNPQSEYYIWACDYQRLIKGKNLWRIWLIDEYGDYWLEVNYLNEESEPEFHTLKLEPGTFDTIEADEYQVLCE